MKNTVIVVLVAISIAIVFAFLAAVALEKYRFTGRKTFLVLADRRSRCCRESG